MPSSANSASACAFSSESIRILILVVELAIESSPSYWHFYYMPFARRKQCNARKSTNIPYHCRRCRKSPHITPCSKASRHCISTNSRPKHSVSCAKGQKQGPENSAVTETLNKQLFLNLPYVLNNSENTPELSMNSKGTQRSQAFVLHSIFCTPRHISPAESTR